MYLLPLLEVTGNRPVRSVKVFPVRSWGAMIVAQARPDLVVSGVDWGVRVVWGVVVVSGWGSLVGLVLVDRVFCRCCWRWPWLVATDLV